MQKRRPAGRPIHSGRLLTLSAMIATTLVSAACVPLAATGIALGAIAVIDRRTIGAQTEDQGIELKAVAELRKVITDASGVAVTSFNRRVLLTGQVLSGIDKQNAGAIIAGLPNVRGVYNELEIAGKSSLGSDAADATLTTKVKTVLLRDKVVPGNSVKVKTEQAVVYLMGLVTNEEAQRAAELTSQVSGVSRVITVFEILSVEEAQRLSSEVNPTSPAQPAAQQPVPAAPSVAPPVGAPATVPAQPGQVNPVPAAPSGGVTPVPAPPAVGVSPVTAPGVTAPGVTAPNVTPPAGTVPAATVPATTPAVTPPATTQPPLVAPPKTQ